MARKFKVRVEEFAFGFPPRLASIISRGTRYALNLFPLGGYVKIYGEDGEEAGDPESFSSRPLRQRLAILVAGVVMNMVLAWFLFSLGHGFGLPTVLDEDQSLANAKVTIIGVAPDSPAQFAGLRFGDTIAEIRSQPALGRAGARPGESEIRIQRIDDVQQFVTAHRGEKILISVKRGEELLEKIAVPRRDPPSGQGPLGIAMARVGIVRSPWWRSPWDGLKTTASATAAIANAIVKVGRDFFTRGKVTADVSGPVGIFAFAHETRRLGLVYLLELAGIISVNLALLNILPIPALDGGRILFLFIEKVRGVRLNPRLEQAVHTVGFAALIALLAAVTYRDVVRIF